MYQNQKPTNVFEYASVGLSFLGYSFVMMVTFIIGYLLTLIPGSVWSLPIFSPLDLSATPFASLNHYDWLGLLQYFKPQWTLLLVIYWALAKPEVMGVVGAWLVGLGLDILQVGLIGEYALIFSSICYLTLVYRDKLLRYHKIQQMFAVFALLILSQLAVAAIQFLMKHPPNSWAYAWSSVSGALLWPILVAILPKLNSQ